MAGRRSMAMAGTNSGSSSSSSEGWTVACSGVQVEGLRAVRQGASSDEDREAASDQERRGRSASSDSDAQAPREAKLQEDVFAHAAFTFLRTNNLQHEDTLRALCLVVIVLVCQVVVAVSLFHHCWRELWAYPADLREALRQSIQENMNPDDPVLARICGAYSSNQEEITDSLGTVYTEFRKWLDLATPTARIEVLHYQLRLGFQLVFVVVAIFWMWRCWYEVRVAWAELAALWWAPSGDEEPTGPSDEYMMLREGSAEPDCSRATPVARSPTDKLSENNIARFLQDAGSKRKKVIASFLLILRFLIAAFLYVDGWMLLCMTEKTIDVIMNALALEFIFDVDELVVKAMVSRTEFQLLEEAKFCTVSPFTQTRRMAKKTDKTCWGYTKSCAFHRRTRVWARIFLIVLVFALFVGPRVLKVRALHSRSKVLCLTSGLTDGSRQPSASWPEVVFPVSGFCRSFVQMYAGLGVPECGSWRLRDGEEYSRGFCTLNGNLERTTWPSLNYIEEDTKRICTEMWFGRGVPEGEPIPALRRTNSDGTVPEMFGCRWQDLTVTASIIPWIFIDFSDGWQFLAKLKCHKPAYGPMSDAWNATATAQKGHLAPSYYFRADNNAPIEHQAASCLRLPAIHHCRDDPCQVRVDQVGTRCSDFCQESGLVCASAMLLDPTSITHRWQCARGSELNCTTFAPAGDHLICKCQLPPEKRKCGALLNARARCDGDPCSVLVSQVDLVTGRWTEYKHCEDYCNSANLTCQGTFREKYLYEDRGAEVGHTCLRDERFSWLDCHSALDAETPTVWSPMDMPPPPQPPPPPPARRLFHPGHGGGSSGGGGEGGGSFFSGPRENAIHDFDQGANERARTSQLLRFYRGVPERVCICG